MSREPTAGPREAPDGLIRDLPRLRRYLRHNAAEDATFAARVKTGLNLSNDALDAIVREETDAVWAQIDCLDCGHCCRTLQIVVDARDIARLATRLEMPTAAFTQRFVRTAPDRTRHLATSPCPFLGEDNRCSVYEDRPQACRDFPYLHAAGFRQRVLVTLENAGLCPIVFNLWQRLKQRLKGRKSS